ncbi:DUF1365 domain-containing protein [Cupriavidus metallidurans]|uniref:DUF1365 domain-containing protein n=1 Tax=Cupriavidus metallidurans TaxID=119219 RepID=UPI001F3EC556|nr:DUF1365 domain-containing protein [Cupriavidus metallidurans]
MSRASAADPIDAQLLRANVMHERLRPVRHRFVYPVFCLRLNLDALPRLRRWWFGVDRWRLLSLRRRDYGPRDGSELAPWMRARLREAGVHADGEIWLQTFPRVFGYAFNPVSFWLCHDRAGDLRALLAEVNNTFGERYAYLMAASDGGPILPAATLHCRKVLHVSPFCRVEGHYEFRVRTTPDTAFVGITYHDADGPLIRTAIGGRILPFARGAVLGALSRQPWMALAVVVRIHWQALRLWLRHVPFYGRCPPAPSTTATQSSRDVAVKADTSPHGAFNGPTST